MNYRSVLLVHKNSEPITKLSHTLENVGHQVNVASCSADALLVLRNERPDAIIASDDLRNPDVSEFCREIKKLPALNGVRVMVIAKQKSPGKRKKLLENGADDYVSEPFTLPALLERVNALFFKDPQASSDAYHIELSGSITQSGLVDILQLLEFSAKSGLLTITSGIQHGTMAFSNGRLISARMSEKRNEPAVYEMLSWEEGEFEFQAQEMPNSTNGGIASISSLVLEWARTKDESLAASAISPPVQQEEEQKPVSQNWASELNAWLGYLRDQ